MKQMNDQLSEKVSSLSNELAQVKGKLQMNAKIEESLQKKLAELTIQGNKDKETI